MRRGEAACGARCQPDCRQRFRGVDGLPLRCCYNQPGCVEVLVRAGCDMTAKDQNERAGKDLAEEDPDSVSDLEEGCMEVLECLARMAKKAAKNEQEEAGSEEALDSPAGAGRAVGYRSTRCGGGALGEFQRIRISENMYSQTHVFSAKHCHACPC